MLSTKARTIIVALAASASIGVAPVSPAVSSAAQKSALVKAAQANIVGGACDTYHATEEGLRGAIHAGAFGAVKPLTELEKKSKAAGCEAM